MSAVTEVLTFVAVEDERVVLAGPMRYWVELDT
jgi:hypothetical protein